MALAQDFRGALRQLPEVWREARFTLRFRDPQSAARAAGYLGPITPGRHGDTVRFAVARSGPGHRPDTAARALARLDRERLHGELELVSSEQADEKPAVADGARRGAAARWDATLATLPPDWSDVYAEVTLRSTDDLERTALLLSPLNPSRIDARPALRFRVAHSFGYGAAPELVRRCLARIDEAGVRAEVNLLHALSGTRPVGTQGPVWYVGGRPV